MSDKKRLYKMSNFDFLKDFNNELYEIGVNLEKDVITTPRAVTADATIFLEELVKDIYEKSNSHLASNLITFNKKINNLYRLGVISYVYKNKLQEAYNLRNQIHGNYQSIKKEYEIAIELNKRLYYISKKYYMDFSDNGRYIQIPKFKKPDSNHFSLEKCIICGCENKNTQSNMCTACNNQIEIMNYFISLQNSFKDNKFTKQDLIDYGISESKALSLIHDLSKEKLIDKKEDYYTLNIDEFKDYESRINEYVQIGIMVNSLYNDEITIKEIRKSSEYKKGMAGEFPYIELFNIINSKLMSDFEQHLNKLNNIKQSIRKSSISEDNIDAWFKKEKEEFKKGELNESFIKYNELLINDYFTYLKRNPNEDNIRSYLNITDEIYEFWENEFIGEEFSQKLMNIKKDILLDELKRNKSIREALKLTGISRQDFEKLYDKSKKENSSFYVKFKRIYINRRKKLLIKHLKKYELKKAIRITKITENEFYEWYFDDEAKQTDFYLNATRLLMDKYLNQRLKGTSKKDILDNSLKKEIFNSWNGKTQELFLDFENKNSEITANLLKRGLIINALKEDKSKSEALKNAGFSEDEFNRIYSQSKKEKTDFCNRFDTEYRENRKRLFVKMLKDNDFYNSIVKSEISQKDFNEWYLKDKAKFLSDDGDYTFYVKTTVILMDNFLKARKNGMNEPDSAKRVGLSNNEIKFWLNNDEIPLYSKFKNSYDELKCELITQGFRDLKSKNKVSNEYDIPVKQIENFIKSEEYNEISELYYDNVIPNQLETFLEAIKTKLFKKALKHADLSEKELNEYYELGARGDEKYSEFHDDYLEMKKNIYANTVINKKSEKIAFKNSNLSRTEYENDKDKIQYMINNARMYIICAELFKRNNKINRLADISGAEITEIYDWYIRGQKGEKDFEVFSAIFEVAHILPRVMAFNRAVHMGVPKNRALKVIKKELGSKEYDIWIKYGLLDESNLDVINIDEIDEAHLSRLARESEFVKQSYGSDDSDMFELVKKAVKYNAENLRYQINLDKV